MNYGNGLHILNLDFFKTAETFLYFKLGLFYTISDITQKLSLNN